MIYLKRIGCLVAVMWTLVAGAQTSIYIHPSAGYGLGNMSSSVQFYEVPVKQAGIDIGFDNAAWRFEAGLRYFTSGYKEKAVPLHLLNSNGQSINATATRTQTFRHYAVSFSGGYAFHVTKGLKLIPGLNGLFSYNRFVTASYQYNGTEWDDDDYFKGFYHAYSFWAGLHLGIEYNVTERLAITLTPEYYIMVNSLIGSSPGSSWHNHNAVLNLGVNWWLKAPAKKKKLPKWEDEHPSS